MGYATENRRLLLTHPIALPAWRQAKHEVYHYLHLVGELERALTGGEQVSDHQPSDVIRVSTARRAAARHFLIAHGARLERPLVLLCPGSTNSRAKRWPTCGFAALADQLIAEMGAEVILIGSGEEKESGRGERADESSAAHLDRGTDLSLTIAILSLADLLVSNDTGPAHIAAALGRPTLVIFGPTNPVRTRPFSAAAEIIREPPACAPCMLRDCPIDHRCMTAITPAHVFSRSAAILKARLGAEEVHT
ncbi:MAG: glycosyltransferase family 9 protein [Pyrinomonadaceae bacterium]